MKLIGIQGKKGSGKDEVAKIIQYLIYEDEYDSYEDYLSNPPLFSEWEIKSFATKLKEMSCIILGCTMDDFESQEFKSSALDEKWSFTEEEKESMIGYDRMMYSHLFDMSLTPRHVIQMLGDQTRSIHPNVWVTSLFNDYEEASKWLISDVRFPNEFEAVKSRDGIMIKVERKERGKTDDTDNHPTETALDSYKQPDHVIGNNGTIPQLIKNVRKVLIKEGLI